MKKIFLFFTITGILLGLILGVCSSLVSHEKVEIEDVLIEEEYGNELYMPLIELDTLNPILTKNKQVADILKLIYEPLFGFDEKNRLVPMLGESYMEKDDGGWIVKVKKNIIWHSGKEFTINDVIFTINSIKNNPDSTYYNSLKNISNVERIDDYSVTINLNEKDSLLPYKLDFPIIPEYYFRDSLSDNEKLKRAVGTGPYAYSEESEDRIKLVFNEKWWKQNTAKLGTIYLKQYQTYGEAIKGFKSSEIDVITTSMLSWKKKFGVIGINSYKYSNTNYDVIIPNCGRTVLKDSSVRKAILYAINRDNIIDEVYNGNANKQDVLSLINTDEEPLEYSADKAKQLLWNSSWNFKNNLWTKNIKGKTYSLKFSLMVSKGSESKLKAAKMIKEDLQSIGIKLNISEVDSNTFLKNINNYNFDLAIATFESKNEYDVLKLLQNGNYANYDSSIMAESLQQLYMSNISLKEAFNEVYSKYKNELPYIGLYYETNTLLTNKAVKGNITPTYGNPYHNIYDWTK